MMSTYEMRGLEPRVLLAFSAKALPLVYQHPSYEPVGWYDGEIRLSWTAEALPAHDGFRIFRSEGGKRHFMQVGEVSQPSYVDRSLSVGTKYFYRVRPYTLDAGSTASIGTASAVTHLPTPSATFWSDADGTVRVRADGDGETVTAFRYEWTEAESGVKHQKTVTADWEGGADLFPFANTVITGLASSKSYQFSVFAINNVKDSEPVTQSFAPVVPATLKKSQRIDRRTIRVQWSSSSAAVTAFKLEWSRDLVHWSEKVAGKDDRSSVLKSLQTDKTYHLRITALVGDFESLSDSETT